MRRDGSSKLGELPRGRLEKLPNLHIRELRPTDREKLLALHLECFPVSYEPMFFDKAVQGQLFSRVAAVNTTGERADSPRLYANAEGWNGNAMLWEGVEPREDMAGVIISQVSPHGEFEDTVLDRGSRSDDRVAYICTLGVWDKYRQHGLAAKLLGILIDWAEAEPSIKALSLHVLTTNKVALYFYERYGFTRLKTLNDFYTINGKSCDAYLYARHLNGGSAPSSWISRTFDNLKRPIVSVCLATWHQFSATLRRLGVCGVASGSSVGVGASLDGRSVVFTNTKQV